MSYSSETKVAILEQRMENIEDKVNIIEKKLDAGFEKLEKIFYQGLDKKADKEGSWAEDALRWVAYIIIGAVLAGLLTLLGLRTF